MNRTKYLSTEQKCKLIASALNSISIPMTYGELKLFLQRKKCPYYIEVISLKNSPLFFDQVENNDSTGSRMFYKYKLRKQVTYHDIYSIFNSKPHPQNMESINLVAKVPTKDEVCKIISSIINSITKPMRYSELETYLKIKNCPMRKPLFQKRELFFYKDMIGGLKTENIRYILRDKPTHYKKFYVLFDKKSEKVQNSPMPAEDIGAVLREQLGLATQADVFVHLRKLGYSESAINKYIKIVQKQQEDIQKDEKGNIMNSIEFNFGKQQFRIAAGPRDMSGWQTVRENVTDTSLWTAFDIFRDGIFNIKFSSVIQISDMFDMFEKYYQAYFKDMYDMYQAYFKKQDLTVETCINFLKSKGFAGKLEKLETLTL